MLRLINHEYTRAFLGMCVVALMLWCSHGHALSWEHEAKPLQTETPPLPSPDPALVYLHQRADALTDMLGDDTLSHADRQLQAAFRAVLNAEYARAAGMFRYIRKHFPDSRHAIEAQLALAALKERRPVPRPHYAAGNRGRYQLRLGKGNQAGTGGLGAGTHGQALQVRKKAPISPQLRTARRELVWYHTLYWGLLSTGSLLLIDVPFPVAPLIGVYSTSIAFALSFALPRRAKTIAAGLPPLQLFFQSWSAWTGIAAFQLIYNNKLRGRHVGIGLLSGSLAGLLWTTLARRDLSMARHRAVQIISASVWGMALGVGSAFLAFDGDISPRRLAGFMAGVGYSSLALALLIKARWSVKRWRIINLAALGAGALGFAIGQVSDNHRSGSEFRRVAIITMSSATFGLLLGGLATMGMPPADAPKEQFSDPSHSRISLKPPGVQVVPGRYVNNKQTHAFRVNFLQGTF